jgi:hypothetical protein
MRVHWKKQVRTLLDAPNSQKIKKVEEYADRRESNSAAPW